MIQTERNRLAKENRLAAIEETQIRAEMKEEARLIPKKTITAFLEKAREKARSSFYIDGDWAYQSSGSFEKIFFSGALVLEEKK